MSRIWLVAALLGVGFAEAMKKVLHRAGSKRDLPFVLAGVAGGVLICHQLSRMANPSVGIESVLPDIISAVIILLCVMVRFWR